VLAGLGFSGDSINPTKKQGIVTYGLVFAMFGAHKLEKMNEMRDHSNCGTNTLCAYKHEWPLRASAGFLENAKMNEDTQKLWIELDGSEEDGMFYLASPCKADLTVRKTECKCREFFDSETVYSNIVIQESVVLEGVYWPQDMGESPNAIGVYTIHVKFPKNGDEFVHKFKYTPGESVTFTYMPEDSTPGEWKEITLKEDSDVNDPLMLEQAVRSMEKNELGGWIEQNSEFEIDPLYIESDKYMLDVIDRYESNYGQNTPYKSCVKGDWWAFWEGPDKTVECIKIKAEGYGDYEPNFCYERKWDSASKAEVGLFAGEVAIGIVAAAIASPSGPGSIAAYCATTTAVSAAGAWLLVGTMAADKWPHGIDQ
jgi:hypothetical protein